MKIKSKKNLAIAFLSNVLNTETYDFGLKIEKELGKLLIHFLQDSKYHQFV